MPDAKAAKEQTSEAQEQVEGGSSRGRQRAIGTTALATRCASGAVARGGRARASDVGGGPATRRAVSDGARLGRALPSRWSKRAGGDAADGKAERAGERRGGTTCSDCRDKGRAPAGGEPAHPRCDEAVPGDRRLGDDGAAGVERRAGAKSTNTREGKAATEGASLRACRAQSALAVGSLHVPAAQARAHLRCGVSRRSLALSGEPGDGPSPAKHARARGACARDRRVRDAPGDPDRPGAAVHRVARLDRVRGGAQAPRDPSREEPPASPPDLRQDRAVLEDDVGGVPRAHGVRGLRGLRASRCALCAALQLPAPAPGARGGNAGRSVLPRSLPGARGDREDGRRERAAPRARASTAQALLPRRAPRGPGPLDQRERGAPQGASG